MPHKAKRFIFANLRRVAILAVMYGLSRPMLCALGRINRRLGFLQSIFVMYPATERYALKIVYRPWLRWKRWNPFPVMLYRQNRKWGIVFAISATEDMVRSPDATPSLQILYSRAKDLQETLAAKTVTFSGILPGVFATRGIVTNPTEAIVTVKAVTLGLLKLIATERLPHETPVIIIGGAGFIGSRLAGAISRMGSKVYVADPSGGSSSLPEELRNSPTIIINVANHRALSLFIPAIWPDAILFNEVYPEPSNHELATLRSIGVRAYHMVGVKANAYPPFPKAYRGGIPCCAAFDDPQMEAVIRRIA